jgi:CubicO group peptidase (beta-lactamase class C family)
VRQNRAAAALSFLVVTFAPASAVAQSSKPDLAAVIGAYRASLPETMAKQRIPGLAVAVTTDRELLWAEGFGVTAEGGAVPVTSETRFSAQSMSKNFTAAAVLAAVRDGLVGLDVPITAYLPDFAVRSRFEDHPERKMTLRLLLSHRAGFTHEAPDGNNYDPGTGSFEDHVRSISRTWLRFPVGERYCYSNLGIDLAGWVLQVRSGLPFAEYVRRYVLVPAGLTAASFDVEDIRGDALRAIGHNRMRTPVAVEVPMLAAGGLYAGAAELAAWVRMHLNKGRVGDKSILPEELLSEMSAIAFADRRHTHGYGLGLAVAPHEGTVLLNHGGGGYGFLTYMGWSPELKIGVVVLTNSSGHDVQTSLPLEILGRFAEAGAGIKPLPPAPDPAAGSPGPRVRAVPSGRPLPLRFGRVHAHRAPRRPGRGPERAGVPGGPVRFAGRSQHRFRRDPLFLLVRPRSRRFAPPHHPDLRRHESRFQRRPGRPSRPGQARMGPLRRPLFLPGLWPSGRRPLRGPQERLALAQQYEAHRTSPRPVLHTER